MSCYSCDAKPRHWDPEGNTNLQGAPRHWDPQGNINLQGHPNTVRAPRTPIYQLGWLGDDSVDFTDLGPTVDSPIVGPFDYTSTFAPSPDNPDIPANPDSGVIYGPPGPGQPGSTASSAAGSLTQAITSIFRPSGAGSRLTLPPGPSPRVSTTSTEPITISIAQALPMLALVAGAIIVVPALLGGRRRRR